MQRVHPYPATFFFLKMLTAFYSFLLHIYLRNEFNFWNVHGIMNTLGLLQSNKGLHVNFARDPKYSLFHEQIKNEFIAYIYI